MINTILFDLDGTLIDTAPDLAYALNQLRQQYDLAPLSLDVITPTVSLGGVAMLKLALNIKPESDDFEIYRKQFLDIYSKNIAKHSRLFDGIQELLEKLESESYSWGIVTNKSEWLTIPLLEELKLTQRTACVVCGDTAAAPKPDPAPMFYACNQLDVMPNQCVYVGDAHRDVQAGNAAGMKTIVALYGYIEVDSDPNAWKADHLIKHPQEIFVWLEQQNLNGR